MKFVRVYIIEIE